MRVLICTGLSLTCCLKPAVEPPDLILVEHAPQLLGVPRAALLPEVQDFLVEVFAFHITLDLVVVDLRKTSGRWSNIGCVLLISTCRLISNALTSIV